MEAARAGQNMGAGKGTRRAGLGRVAAWAASFVLAVMGVASASVAPSAVREGGPGISAAAPGFEIARGKKIESGAGAKTPHRGSSAELGGGSSADRYGGSSADTRGVAGRRDVRVYGKPKTEKKKEDVDAPPRKHKEDDQDQDKEDRDEDQH